MLCDISLFSNFCRCMSLRPIAAVTPVCRRIAIKMELNGCCYLATPCSSASNESAGPLGLCFNCKYGDYQSMWPGSIMMITVCQHSTRARPLPKLFPPRLLVVWRPWWAWALTSGPSPPLKILHIKPVSYMLFMEREINNLRQIRNSGRWRALWICTK